MSTSSDLNKLKQQIITDNVCPELASQATQLVFGSGNPDADIVFIGEAPGKKEDETGTPFVGAAGKFLEEMLESIQLSRRDVYITNIVKYRPPKNRDPSPEEKCQFVRYLTDELTIINPLLIVTLGRHSMNVLLPGLIISQVHGQLQTDGTRHILPLYHPAAALYNGGLRQTLKEDFAKIPHFLQEIK